jgi:cell division protein YceG involved in septum cleavage
VDDKPPSLTVVAGDEEPPDAPRPPRRTRSHAVPVAVGIFFGTAAIVAAVLLVGRNDNQAAPPPPPATTAPPQLEVLRIVFPEGFTRTEMGERIVAVNEIAEQERGVKPALSADDYLRATRPSTLEPSLAKLPPPFRSDKNVKGFEGFLFPATYEFTEATTSPELVDQQLETFSNAWSQIDLAYATKRNLTAYDVLIIASMIEGEVQVPKERALVSAVIYNRLKARMTLGIDATLRYGLDIPPTRAIRQSELEDPTPYNTRIHPGLPPTPIGNPGLASMQAAAHPADVDYLFFVRKKDCKSHFFTASEGAFLKRLKKPRC